MTTRFALIIFGLTAALISAAGVPAPADTLARLKAKGELVVGVKDGYPPFGYRNDEGELTGLEIDLAQDIAERLGVTLKLFPVSSSSRMQFLQQNEIDLVLATVGITGARKREAGLVQPYYYASSFALLVPHAARGRSVSDFRGKSVCTMRSLPVNQHLASRAPGIEVVSFRDRSKALKALARGKCAAFADEDVHVLYLKNQENDGVRYDVLPIEGAPLPWAMAVQPKELNTDFGKFLSTAITDWHKSGKLLALEKKWLGENTPWLLEMHEKLK